MENNVPIQHQGNEFSSLFLHFLVTYIFINELDAGLECIFIRFVGSARLGDAC